MSLLIDALRKAEEQKRRGEPERPPAAGPSRSAATAAAGDAQAARNLFEVKTGPRAMSFPVAVGLFTSLALVAIGIYFWLQLNPPGPRLVAITPSPALPPATSHPASEPSPPSLPTGPSGLAQPDSPVAQAPASNPSLAPPAPAAPVTAVRPSKPAAIADAHPRPPPRPAPAEAAPVPIVRRSRQAAVPPDLESAWRAYQAGELARAATLYRRVLAANPRSADALNGMGAITARAGRRDEAADWFRRSLAARPGDAVALSGLSGLGSEDGSSTASAGRLKSAVASQPDQAALHFALGNALAAESRWAEAQSSYFRAHGLDQGNPDYLFNLGVSLDQMGKRMLARRFYGEALAAARSRPHAFDTRAAEARLASLTPVPAEAARD